MAVGALRMALFTIVSAVTSIDNHGHSVDGLRQRHSWLFRSVADSELARDTENVIASVVFLNQRIALGAEHCL